LNHSATETGRVLFSPKIEEAVQPPEQTAMTEAGGKSVSPQEFRNGKLTLSGHHLLRTVTLPVMTFGVTGVVPCEDEGLLGSTSR
jgi:hypothetical protein